MFGGGNRDRTCDLLNANQMLSQLSYAPESCVKEGLQNPGGAVKQKNITFMIFFHVAFGKKKATLRWLFK